MPPPPSVALVSDTNVLFTQDKTRLPGSRLRDTRLQWQNVATVRSYIPEIVLWELRYQYVAAARGAADAVRSNTKAVAEILDVSLQPMLSDESIVPLVEARLQRWLTSNSISLLTLPTADIPWSHVVERAVWQRPPFSRTDDKRASEKGFKDCLLLETLRHHHEALLAVGAVMFVSNDQLLRDTVDVELGGNERLRCFESLDALGSFLRLQHELSTRQLADAVQAPARRAFHDAATRTGLFFTADVPGSLGAKFGAHFDDPTLSEPPSLFMPRRGRRRDPFSSDWSPAKEGLWQVEDPVFVDLASPERLRWSSAVGYFRLYSKQPWAASSLSGYGLLREPLARPQEPDYRLLFLPFTVTWLGTLSSDGSLSDLAVEKVEMGKGQFEEYIDDDADSSHRV